ncbi:MAG: nitrate- and nitrite sensing domain-containing protein [Burkholderiaceae bacterium]
MPSGLHFLIAAKRSEIADLTQLAQTSALVSTTAQIVHALQLERGLSNLYLASTGDHWTSPRQEQVERSVRAEITLRTRLAEMVEAGEPVLQRPRVLNRIALALQGLDALPFLRRDVDDHLLRPAQATASYSRVIETLMSMIFEAADTAADPRVSQCLVAMFNFMQGKECAGQERAVGAAQFAAGITNLDDRHHLMRLIESQERSLGIFAEFAGSGILAVWQNAPELDSIHYALQRYRRMLLSGDAQGPLNPELSQNWFDLCTDRINVMKRVEDALAADLLEHCKARIAVGEAELAQYEQLRQAPLATEEAREQAARLFFRQATGATPVRVEPSTASAEAPRSTGRPELERSILDLVQAQAHQLQVMNEELEATRASLNERKVIERAKGLLMAHRRLSEEQAHKSMRQMAMNQNRRMIDVAHAILSMAEVLPFDRPA